MSDQECAEVWEAMPDSPFRKVLEFELRKRAAAEEQGYGSAKTLEDFKKRQGIVEGIGIALGYLKRETTPK